MIHRTKVDTSPKGTVRTWHVPLAENVFIGLTETQVLRYLNHSEANTRPFESEVNQSNEKNDVSVVRAFRDHNELLGNGESRPSGETGGHHTFHHAERSAFSRPRLQESATVSATTAEFLRIQTPRGGATPPRPPLNT